MCFSGKYTRKSERCEEDQESGTMDCWKSSLCFRMISFFRTEVNNISYRSLSNVHLVVYFSWFLPKFSPITMCNFKPRRILLILLCHIPILRLQLIDPQAPHLKDLQKSFLTIMKLFQARYTFETSPALNTSVISIALKFEDLP